MNECFWEENTAGVHEGDLDPELLELGVSYLEELGEHGVDKLHDDDGVLLPAAAQEAGVAELVEAGGLVPAAPLPLPLVEEELVPPGLALAPHHALHSTHRFRRTKKMC